ncbi:uncharacterized protein BDR25DRAFT_396952 [Lindgomyces ingoldianus]|uniref:Uncharacterized protein n=1 Tax=Lindgomyces ingoldianus TaxID=673940 RepID=A0ACB6QCQ5_9PLEO|nr:uncharacterized protein BDR25DRAFT_396952 [Lindgomyces ingoldianus]KAF2463897.1 hypothetical protein BDR25DRAFT_396952 [Lindgomyces ingoldianus]
MATDSNWLHFAANPPKRKRAELVCIACHSKKIKCDIQSQRSQEINACTNCSNSGRECRIRPSKRERRRRPRRDGETQDATAPRYPSPSQITNGVDALLAADATFQEFTAPNTTSNAAAIDPNLNRTDQSPTSLHYPRAMDFRPNPSPGNLVHILQNDSPARRSQVSNGHTDSTPTQLGDVDTGFLQVYGPENQFDAENQALVAQLEHRYSSELQPDLQQIFTETYFEYCYPWCPVLDRATLSAEISRSPLLANALALAASHVQPPLLPHDGPEAYYKKARTIFYEDEEADIITSLKSLCLFYWWAPQAPSRVHRHSSWWWTSVIIRHAQQMNIHRETVLSHPHSERLDLSLRRRIWWTVFARERLTALCQSKPAIIDPDDCSMKQPTLGDFPIDPQSQRKGEIFIQWVRLCSIIGRIAKILSRLEKPSSAQFPYDLCEELIAWVYSLPPHLRLRIDSARTESFDRDVHQLHLPYLTTIIVLHLKRSGGNLPQALPPAILAASCSARILKDILARGNSRFLMAITCWHVATAFIALLQACRIDHLSKYANEDLDILTHTVKQLQKMWASANVISQGFDRLRGTDMSSVIAADNGGPQIGAGSISQLSLQHTDAGFPTTSGDMGGSSLPNGHSLPEDDDFDWMRFFPFVTKSTNGIAQSLISGREHGTATRGFPSPNNEVFHDTLLAQYQDLFDPFTEYNMNMPNSVFDP